MRRTRSKTVRRAGIFDADRSPEEREELLIGAELHLHRTVAGVDWDEIITATSLIHYNPRSGEIELYAVGGKPRDKFDPRRECGQYTVIDQKEIVKIR